MQLQLKGVPPQIFYIIKKRFSLFHSGLKSSKINGTYQNWKQTRYNDEQGVRIYRTNLQRVGGSKNTFTSFDGMIITKYGIIITIILIIESIYLSFPSTGDSSNHCYKHYWKASYRWYNFVLILFCIDLVLFRYCS